MPPKDTYSCFHFVHITQPIQAKNRKEWLRKIYSERIVELRESIQSHLNMKFSIPNELVKEMFLGNDTFDFLLLDHDLGSIDVYEDGNKLMGILEERYFLEGFRKFSRIIPISSNPVGIKVINQISERICKK